MLHYRFCDITILTHVFVSLYSRELNLADYFHLSVQYLRPLGRERTPLRYDQVDEGRLFSTPEKEGLDHTGSYRKHRLVRVGLQSRVEQSS